MLAPRAGMRPGSIESWTGSELVPDPVAERHVTTVTNDKRMDK